MSDEWSPLTLDELSATMAPARFRWWVSGGRALELHVGESWRSHSDIDLGLLRSDAPRLVEVLVDWELFVAAGGVVRPWDGDLLRVERNENNLWARRPGADRWSIDITIGDGTREQWVYRRNNRVRLPWSEAVLGVAAGLPYLAPEAQLLFKSRHPRRPKDDHDAAVVLPRLAEPHSTRLRGWLAPPHPWQKLLAAP